MSVEQQKKPETAASREPCVLLSHPTGNQNVRNALLSLAERNNLAEFWTTIAWNARSHWNRFIPAGLRAQLARRTFPEAAGDRIKCVPFRELVRLATRSSRMSVFFSLGEQPFSVIGMYRHFDGRVARRVREIRAGVVYAYEGGALQTFREAKKQGMVTILEQPSSYWHWVRRVLSEEAERRPEFAALLPALQDSAGHLEWKEEELRLADYVFVPSRHVQRTLAGVVSDEKIRVVNYGAPPVQKKRDVSLDRSRPLKVLFVGALTQHKGIGYLLEAVDQLGSRVELTLVGRRMRANPRVDDACERWRWFETLSHSGVLAQMWEADVLVLPSLSEAWGMVVTEAMACGLPVVITPHTGSIELVRDGYEGFVVPIGESTAIAERLNTLHQDRDLLATMSQRAQATAGKQTWERYRANWADAVREVSCR